MTDRKLYITLRSCLFVLHRLRPRTARYDLARMAVTLALAALKQDSERLELVLALLNDMYCHYELPSA